jgi:hypothetical protein
MCVGSSKVMRASRSWNESGASANLGIGGGMRATRPWNEGPEEDDMAKLFSQSARAKHYAWIEVLLS